MYKKNSLWHCLAFILLTGCFFQGSYQPPAIPLKVVVNSLGEITVDVSTEFVTPLGIFEIGAVSDSTSFFDTVENTLVIRTDSYDCAYDLRGRNFEIQFDSGLEVRRLEKDSQNNILLELNGDYSGCQQTLTQPASYLLQSSNCYVPYEPSLVLGQRTTIAIYQASVWTGPSASYGLVRNNYLQQGRAVTLLEGPVCGETRSGGNSWWWKLKSDEIRLADGQRVVIVGWVAEKDDDTNLLAP
jgi:hypothetical protein